MDLAPKEVIIQPRRQNETQITSNQGQKVRDTGKELNIFRERGRLVLVEGIRSNFVEEVASELVGGS